MRFPQLLPGNRWSNALLAKKNRMSAAVVALRRVCAARRSKLRQQAFVHWKGSDNPRPAIVPEAVVAADILPELNSGESTQKHGRPDARRMYVLGNIYRRSQHQRIEKKPGAKQTEIQLGATVMSRYISLWQAYVCSRLLFLCSGTEHRKGQHQ